MTTYKAIIVEDDPSSVDVLLAHLSDLKLPLQVEAIVDNVKDAYAAIQRVNPQVVLLDIELHGETSFDLLNQLAEPTFQFIFITGHDDYALRAIKQSALDYLLKPVNKAELRTALEKAIQKTAATDNQRLLNLQHNLTAEHPKLVIVEKNKMKFVNLKDVVCIEADGGYSQIYCSNQEQILSSKNLGHYENILDPNQFMKVHRSFIINLHYIKEYVPAKGILLMSNDVQVKISKQAKAAFLGKISGID